MRYCIAFDEQGSPYISHHGIKGQKWGDRNGPPYPLDYKAHSKAEKKENPKALITPNDDAIKKVKSSTSDDAKIKSASLGEEFKNKSNDKFAEEILKKNPNAAIVNPKLKEWAKAHKKELIAVGLMLGAQAAYIAASKYYGADGIFDIIDAAKGKAVANVVDQYKNSKLEHGGFDSGEKRFIAQWLKADIHRFDAISEAEFQNMSDDDGVALSAGQQLFRMSKGEHNNLRDGIEYVSFGDDRERYKGFLPQMWRANQFFGEKPSEFFETELKALGDIKAPSKKETISILEAALKKRAPGLSDDRIHAEALKNFYKYQMNLIDRNNAFNKLFFEEVKSRGYNSVVDWNDAGRLADKPLILLQGSKQVSIENITKYSHKQTREFFKNIKLPSNVSDFSVTDWYSEPQAVAYDMYVGLYVNA